MLCRDDSNEIRLLVYRAREIARAGIKDGASDLDKRAFSEIEENLRFAEDYLRQNIPSS